MFGTSLDYLLLRGLAHRGNLATEEQLDRRFGELRTDSFEQAMAKVRKLVGRFEGHLPVDGSLRYLDMGCGSGELTLALTRLGVRHITGVDYLRRNIERAQNQARRAGAGPGVRFVHQDLHQWVPEEKYDVLLSIDAFEHVANPKVLLRKMHDFVAPDGIAVVAFGPLFHSPFGDHMWDFFRLQIPWRGVLFSEKAILRVRKECFRPTDAANRFSEIAGGLNLMRYSEFVRYVADSKWRFDYLAVNTFLKRAPPLRLLSDAVMRVPVVQDYFPHNVYAVLRRAGS